MRAAPPHSPLRQRETVAPAVLPPVWVSRTSKKNVETTRHSRHDCLRHTGKLNCERRGLAARVPGENFSRGGKFADRIQTVGSDARRNLLSLRLR